MKFVISIAMLALLTVCCAPKVPLCSAVQFISQSSYNVNIAYRTPDGIQVDPSNLAINPNRIDRLFDEVETCLRNMTLTTQEATLGSCPTAFFHFPIPRQCIRVKVASDWILSCDKSQQLLPVRAADLGCQEKGLTPTETCPCYYRVALQDRGATIVTTPSMYNMKDGILRVATGCMYPWSSPKLAACMRPTTGKLDDGSEP